MNTLEKKQNEIICLILRSEGGYNSDEPEHVGGESYAGITPVSYKEWRDRGGKGPNVKSVKELENDLNVIQTYYQDLLKTFHVWDLPDFLQYIYADFFVNARAAAVKIIQEFVGVKQDGVWGPITSKAVNEWKRTIETFLKKDPDLDNDLITAFHNRKIAHYERLVEKNPVQYERYLKGWKRRANHVLAELKPYFETEALTLKAIDVNEVAPWADKEIKPPELSLVDVMARLDELEDLITRALNSRN